MKDNEYTIYVDNDKILDVEAQAIPSVFMGETVEYTTCPNCGGEAILDPEILTSYPPQRRFRCSKCGLVSTGFCHELDIHFKLKDQNEKPKEEPYYRYATNCIICGEETKFNGTIQHPFICGKCKKAIKKLRKMLEEE